MAASVLCAAFGFAPPLAADGTAVAYRMDMAHTGSTKLDGGFAPPLRRAWVRHFGTLSGQAPISYPLIIGGVAYVVVQDIEDANLFALNLTTGKTIWKQHIVDNLESSAHAAYDAGKVFVISTSGLLQAFRADNGKKLWKLQFDGVVPFFTAPPAAQNGLVFISGYTGSAGKLYAVDESTGAINWWKYVDNFGADHSIPTLDASGVFVTYPCNYYKSDLLTGAKIWEKHLHCVGGGGLTAVLHNKKYYVRDVGGGGNLILNARTGKKLGKYLTDTAPTFWSDAQGKQFEYIIYGEVLYAIDPKTHAVLWQFRGDSDATLAPIVVNDFVVETSALGSVYLLDPATGNVAWSDSTGVFIYPEAEHAAVILSGLAAGGNTLLVPTSEFLVAYVMDQSKPRKPTGKEH